jgi:monofunctional biosynthetic peptidoglycan transglycosylase
MKKILNKTGVIFIKALLGCFVASVLLVIIYRFVHPPFTPLMVVNQCKTWIDDDKTNNKIYYEWVDMDDISSYMPLAVMASEDQNFLNHWGFDLDAIESAIKYNKTHKRTIGASTISQQVAKNVFLFPNRNFVRKGLEVYFTFLIELMWSKKRIMEVYLNVIELNKNRFGVQQGALYAFNRKAKNLSKAQCALLAAILPSPKRFSAKNPSGYIYRRQSQIMVQINYLGIDVKKTFY